MTRAPVLFRQFVPALLALGAATVLLQIWLWPFVTDDAYISFRYTARWCAGLGLTFNNGEAVEGFSNPLWTMLVGLPCLWGGSIVQFSQVAGLVFSGLTLGAVWFAASAAPVSWRWTLAAVVTALLLLNPGFQVYATLGMEVPQLAALLSWAMALTFYGLRRATGWPLYMAAVLLGLASISRPEGLLYGALWGLGLFWQHKPWSAPKQLVQLSGLAALVLLPFALYLAFRMHSYGAWLPNTALAKSVAFHYRDWLGFACVMVPVGAALAGALGLFAPRQLLQADNRKLLADLLFAGAGLAFAGLIFTWYGRDDWMAFARFLQPSFPVLLFIAVALLFMQLAAAQAVVAKAVVALVIGASFITAVLASWPWVRGESLAALVMQNTEPTAVATAIGRLFPEPHTLAAGRIGVLAYDNPQHTLWDLYGLTDREQALAVRASGRPAALFAFEIADNPVMLRRPELLMITRSALREGLAAYTGQNLAYLQPHWRCVLRFRQGYWGSYDLWVRHDVRPDLASNCQTAQDPQLWLTQNR